MKWPVAPTGARLTTTVPDKLAGCDDRALAGVGTIERYFDGGRMMERRGCDWMGRPTKSACPMEGVLMGLRGRVGGWHAGDVVLSARGLEACVD